MDTQAPLKLDSPGLKVAYRLLRLCQEQDLSLNELARRADVPLTTLKNILNGASQNPGVATIAKLCGGLGLSLGEFFADPIFIEVTQPKDETEEIKK